MNLGVGTLAGGGVAAETGAALAAFGEPRVVGLARRKRGTGIQPADGNAVEVAFRFAAADADEVLVEHKGPGAIEAVMSARVNHCPDLHPFGARGAALLRQHLGNVRCQPNSWSTDQGCRFSFTLRDAAEVGQPPRAS